jgi:protease I
MEMAELTVACLLGQGFEDSEFRVPYDRLREAGLMVDIIGTRTGEELKGYRGRESVRADRGIDEVRPEEYGALLLPGGYSPDHLRADPRFVAFVRRFDATGHPIAAVCHGPQLLITAGLVKGRTLTAWKTVQQDLQQMGANVKDEPVVIDRNWITSRQPDDLEAFSQALIGALEPREHGAQPRAASEPYARKGEVSVAEAAEEELSPQRPSRAQQQEPGGMTAEPGKKT